MEDTILEKIKGLREQILKKFTEVYGDKVPKDAETKKSFRKNERSLKEIIRSNLPSKKNEKNFDLKVALDEFINFYKDEFKNMGKAVPPPKMGRELRKIAQR